MSESFIFASISVFLYFLGFIPYIYHVFHGRVVPHPFTWTVWFIFASTNCYILLETSGINWSLASIVARTGALLVGVICGWWLIRKITISKFDYFSLLLALMIIIFINLYGMKEAVIAMVCIDLIILLPTLKKIWIDPRSEDSLVWFTTALSQGCLLLSLPFLTFENSFFWFYAIYVNLSVGVFIRLRRKYTLSSISYRITLIVSDVRVYFRDIFLALKNKL